MARRISLANAKALLSETFVIAEDDYLQNKPITIPTNIADLTDRLFKSETQAYREALIGCAVARLLDNEIDIRLPATEHGPNAFSGRSLADGGTAPFLRARSVPISASSPYLSALRGGARFVPGGEPRIQRDKEGFDALVSVVGYLHNLANAGVREYLIFLLRRFVALRESGNISLRQIAKPHLTQLRRLVAGLLEVKSGGRFASMIATALFQTLSECHQLGWKVDFQGINVADKASGAVGDITIRKGDKIILGVEVTERSIDKGRVTLTFDQKVSPGRLDDYLFINDGAPAFRRRDGCG
jgi:SacI restriction endonuclease